MSRRPPPRRSVGGRSPGGTRPFTSTWGRAGAAIVSGGRVLKGAHGASGEIGYNLVDAGHVGLEIDARPYWRHRERHGPGRQRLPAPRAAGDRRRGLRWCSGRPRLGSLITR